MQSHMICFRVVKEPYGWAVRMGEGMMTPFRSRGMAIKHAKGFAEALRQRGEAAEVLIDEPRSIEEIARPRRRRFWA